MACVGLVVIIAWFSANDTKRSHEWQEKQAAAAQFAATAIAPSDLTITDVAFAPAGGSYSAAGNNINVNGIVTNHSKYKLDQLKLDITAVDCPAYFEHLQYSDIAGRSSECRIIGEEQETAHVDSPAGQTRAFRITVHFSGLPSANRNYSRGMVSTLRA